MRDLDQLTSWRADWKGLRVAVLGLGTTGFAAADTLAELGSTVLVVAERADPGRADLLSVIGAELLEAKLDEPPARLVAFDPELIIVSPGFHPAHPLLEWVRERGVPAWGDIELAWRLRDKVGEPAEWITITGTNGKTTTTQLTAHMIGQAGKAVAAVGNIGTTVLDAIRDPNGFDVLVVELSSYQLHWMPREGPGAVMALASTCLNIAPDHFDWHGDARKYRDAKATVYWNTRVACVYNLDDEETRRMVEEAEVEEGCRAVGFGIGTPGPSDFGVVEDLLVDRAFLETRANNALEIATLAELDAAGLSAPHLVADVLAAAALARAYGVPPATVRQAVASFSIDAHRTQLVATSNGIEWVDDSKATNAHAAEASLVSKESVVWIVGGLLKGVDIGGLVAAHASRVKAAVVIGADRAPVLAAFERHAPQTPVFEVDSADTNEVMPEAVRLAAAVATRGDTVLLAPAAASMDQFADYADRGRKFASAVEQLVGGVPDGEPGQSGQPQTDRP